MNDQDRNSYALREWEVLVGNIGTVYAGGDRREAFRVFEEYRGLSRRNVGRAGGEGVVLMAGGGVVKIWEAPKEWKNE